MDSEKVKIYLDEFGIFLGRKRNRFTVKSKEKASEFVADDVDSIIFGSQGVAVSTSALRLAVDSKVLVVFAQYGGWPYAMLMPTRLSGSVGTRREQFLAYNDDRGFLLAKGFTQGKLMNQASVLRLLAKNRKDTNPTLAERLYNAGRSVNDIAQGISNVPAGTIDDRRQALMNVEAEGARLYWEAVAQLLPPELCFPGRKTRGATDAFNAMLNFGYQVTLFPEVWKAVVYAGLDPYAGYLHADRPGKPSMVLDAMEEFRQQVVDRALISLITKSELKPSEILSKDDPSGRILSKDTTRVILQALEERLKAEITHGAAKTTISGSILHQTRQMSRFLRGETKGYVPFWLGW